MTAIAFVGLAAIGTVLRWASGRWNAALPWGTLTVNTVGAFVLGWATAQGFDDMTLLGTALLGSLTTFSTITHESITMHADGQARRAVIYLALTLALGIAAAWLGLLTV